MPARRGARDLGSYPLSERHACEPHHSMLRAACRKQPCDVMLCETAGQSGFVGMGYTIRNATRRSTDPPSLCHRRVRRSSIAVPAAEMQCSTPSTAYSNAPARPNSRVATSSPKSEQPTVASRARRSTAACAGWLVKSLAASITISRTSAMVKCDFAVIELANVSVGARDSSRDPNTLARRSCSSLTLDSPMCRILPCSLRPSRRVAPEGPAVELVERDLLGLQPPQASSQAWRRWSGRPLAGHCPGLAARGRPWWRSRDHPVRASASLMSSSLRCGRRSRR